jgi:hypothetical protein
MLMQHRDGMLNIFIDGLISAALHILPNQRLNFRSKVDFHDAILQSEGTTAAPILTLMLRKCSGKPPHIAQASIFSEGSGSSKFFPLPCPTSKIKPSSILRVFE